MKGRRVPSHLSITSLSSPVGSFFIPRAAFPFPCVNQLKRRSIYTPIQPNYYRLTRTPTRLAKKAKPTAAARMRHLALIAALRRRTVPLSFQANSTYRKRWVGGWVGGWVGRRYVLCNACDERRWVGGWVGRWVGFLTSLSRASTVLLFHITRSAFFILSSLVIWAWVGGWVGGWVEDNEAVGMSYWTLYMGGWVGGWVGGLPGCVVQRLRRRACCGP